MEPENAIAVEDAISGVKAGKAGQFGLVVGVVRDGGGDALRHHGADVVVRDLRDISVTPEKTTQSLPSALEQIGSIENRLRDRQLALFTDYDGTLTPIVQRPEAATLSQDMRSL
ncbi:hypothetical protein MC7420_5842 [Coleofasciculus chthonoplastes PCC 7420]|uniref:Uncharacterized protein n=1 Tax=Coleofasciculus chthonoplastes PCC 7420 TaxID=118168 RepID=B4VVX4_9CYAN|nr:hypothetical protein MC7420_5842 [Coleofasciculus chthonoplastes PCC 7420]